MKIWIIIPTWLNIMTEWSKKISENHKLVLLEGLKKIGSVHIYNMYIYNVFVYFWSISGIFFMDKSNEFHISMWTWKYR